MNISPLPGPRGLRAPPEGECACPGALTSWTGQGPFPSPSTGQAREQAAASTLRNDSQGCAGQLLREASITELKPLWAEMPKLSSPTQGADRKAAFEGAALGSSQRNLEEP